MNNRDKGFTLVELMVTVAILVILLAIGAPQLQTFVAKRSVSTQADMLASALRKARSEAIKRGQTVTICATNDPEAASPTCNTGSTDWSTGWLVFTDAGTSDAIDGNDVLLAVQQRLPSTGGILVANARTISFAANGLAAGNMNSFRIKPKLSGSQADDPNFNQCVVLAVGGRAKFEKLKNGSCSQTAPTTTSS